MVSQWAGRRPKRQAWLTLTRRDNDPRHLATRLVAALATIDPEMGSKALGEVDATGTGLGQRFLQRLLEDLEFAPRSVLVLDDFQVIDNRDLLADLAELVDCVPSPF